MEYMDKILKSINFNQDKPIREIVYECLRENIIKGVIPVGERIVEKVFADKLNISRTPVRDALRRLEMEELVKSIPGKGIVVKKITVEEVIEIYKIRANLEVLAAEEAMENITPEEIKKIQDLLDLTEEMNNQGNVKEVVRLFAEFNAQIYEASRMKRLVTMISKLSEYLKRFRDISMSENKRREKGLKEHREILNAIVEKNHKDIDEIIKRHLQFSMEIVINEIRAQGIDK
ncbi:DNA-binding transcriptional regulator, GntR family [Clostridium amylolyticum]|uniref:DNA-binding transcriptional regulator, GntR family n=1 Tax=Clostridium amylolyticum TaxID=1121298 RepID=A0A1M6LYQ1_9CLOT|nr:GntR family transcriptional regulator [Clostridium amylolyticum]SHJ76321.1 DNA-binding transcriptional regulator, GntR family [Clostridium amylolyticum]